ncbi:MAG: hypothetical protein GY759_18080 [Chloroflexi bacterium]|nr:hypothetical protein [Chloroflexota bacterium]
MGTTRTPNLVAILFFGILFQFFFQLLSDFVAAIYAFGLLGTSIPIQLVVVILLLSPALLILLRIEVSAVMIMVLGKLVLFTRVVEVLFGTGGRMILSGIGVACFLVLLPTFLRDQARREDRVTALELGVGMALALGLSVLLRTLGSGEDISTLGWWQLLGWALAIVATAAWIYLFVEQDELADYKTPIIVHRGIGWGRPIGLSLGIMAVLVLFYFVFTSPVVLSRWTGVNYVAVVAVLMLVLTGCAWLSASRYDLVERLTALMILLWNIVFIIMLALTAYTHQVSFPLDQAAYPLAEPTLSWFQQIPLFLTLLLFPILLIDLRLLTEEIITSQPSIRELGAGFAVASVFLLFMILAQVFTTTYDYIPVIGPLFRDRFWLVHLVAGMVLVVAMFLAYRRWSDALRVRLTEQQGMIVTIFLAAVAALTFIAALIGAAYPPSLSPEEKAVKVLTYNIQQGYNDQGLRDFEGQLHVLKDIDADIIGLQESDLARIANGNADIIRYFADGLDMHSYYGPSTVTGTFGIALLSKYPIANPRTYYLYSAGEQVAVIEAQVEVGDHIFNVYVNHLGNGGPMVQQEGLLDLLQDKDNLIVMGDFNFRPDSEQYAATTATLQDSWLMVWPDWSDDEGNRPDTKIDHIFVTPGMRVLDADFIEDSGSDHPAVSATLGW